MNTKGKILIVRATGHVVSQIAIILSKKGYDVTAMVGSKSNKIIDAPDGRGDSGLGKG